MTSSLLVQLPENLKSFYEEHGYLPPSTFENRSNARLRVRSEGSIRFINAPNGLRGGHEFRPAEMGRVLIKDLSRTGIGIIYHEQIFPEEQFQIIFQQRQLDVLAVRCRRLNEACYEIGGQVLATQVLETVKESE
jgi:hypothetical protein